MLPVLTLSVRIVFKQMRLPPEVLPVVSIHTLRSIRWIFMVIHRMRAPLGLEMIQVEVFVSLHILQHIYSQLFLGVSKGTIGFVLTISIIHISRAILVSVLLWMVELLNTIMSVVTVLLVGALDLFGHEWA
jgi:hypothetical protein